MESLRLATETLKEDGDWAIDSSNCDVALYLLCDRKPSRVTVRSTLTNPLPATAISSLAEMLNNREVNFVFLDSFVAPHNTNTDMERLKYFLANSRVRISQFCGHLDAAGIARIPDDIEVLALAIHSPADATAVADLSSRRKDRRSVVAVSSAVSPRDLRPLHQGQYWPWLNFPGLSDAGVGRLASAIEALMGGWHRDKYYYLLLPNCGLTTQGYLQLVQQLSGLRWQLHSVFIECSGDGRPGPEEQDSIRAALGSIREWGGRGGRVYWEMRYWPYV